MSLDHPAIAPLKARFPSIPLKGAQFRGDTQVIIPAAELTTIAAFLKTAPGLEYNMLADISCVDYLNYAGAPRDGRFGLVYIFNSIPALGTTPAPRLILRAFVDEGAVIGSEKTNPQIASLVPIYAGAEWLEREVYDMFGIVFTGHPDLRRILTWDTYKPHPLRKDYPVTGTGEREAFPIITRDSA